MQKRPPTKFNVLYDKALKKLGIEETYFNITNVMYEQHSQ